MNRFINIICVLILFTSCNSERSNSGKPCLVTYDSLFKTIDTSSLEIIRYTDSAAIEVLDKDSANGQKGLLRFDENGILQYYAFLQNENNDASFVLKYDSVGNSTRSTTDEVVQWNFYRTKDSSIKFTFLLCALDRNYGHITIESGKFKQEHIMLFESRFVKLICATVSIPNTEKGPSGKIYIRGTRQDKCSGVEEMFIDSTFIPFDELNTRPAN